MKSIYSTIALILLGSTLLAQEPIGTWYGTLNIQGTSLPLVFHVTKTGSEYATTMDSPQQGAKGMPTSKTTFTNKTLTVEASSIGMKYTGTYVPDSNKINGTFQQGPVRTPLALSNKAEKASAAPQTRPHNSQRFSL